jgi:hypothetical protein
MRLDLDPEEEGELKLAIQARILILEGLIRRAPKRDRLALGLRRQKLADLFAKIKAMEE